MRPRTTSGTVPWRPRFPRTKTGCLTCRRRRKKCDECKPGCGNCGRNGLACSWPDDVRSPARPPCPPRRPGSSRNPIRLAQQDESRDTILDHVSSKDQHTCVAEATPSSPSVDLISPTSLAWSSALPTHAVPEWPTAIGKSMSPMRAIDLTSTSAMLLQHYFLETAPILSTKAGSFNHYLTSIIPVACSDDLMMHAVLSLSGLHLSAKNRSSHSVRLAALQHRGHVLSNLPESIWNCYVQKNELQTIKVILILLMLCHTEAITRHHKGAIFPHLRACRELILSLSPTSSQHGDTNLRGFALELYAYLVLVANITPYGVTEDRTLHFDTVVTSLSALSGYQTYGIMFSSIHGLFEMIPRLSLLAAERLREEEEGQRRGSSVISHETTLKFKALQATIEEWQPDENPQPSKVGNPTLAEIRSTTELYRRGLLIFLHASACGSVVSNPKAICAIQEHIDPMFALFSSLSQSLLGAILLWPIMIMGSCLTTISQREMLVSRLINCRYRTDNLDQVVDLFTLLWAEDDPRCFGPYGLYVVMRKHDINFCMA